MKISKSKYMDFLRHPAWLWVHAYHKDKLPPVDAATQNMFDAGHDFEQYAEVQFPGGQTIGFNNYREYLTLVDRTRQAISAGPAVLFQPGFEWENFTCISDILVLKEGARADLYEIKSSTKIKADHKFDLAFQVALIENSGLAVDKISVIHVNNGYVRQGAVVPESLTTFSEVTTEVRELVPLTIDKLMPAAKKSLQQPDKIPDMDPDLAKLGAKSNWQKVYDNFYRPKKIDWPAGLKPVVDQSEIEQFLKQLKYPLYFLDYETMQSLVPRFDGQRPYQQIPFQYSLHIIREPGGAVEHKEYLHRDNSDPARPLTQQLLQDIGERGTVLVWYQAFEKSCNSELGEMLPEHKSALEAVNDRIVDLMIPFKSKWYDDPRFEGSASIKNVLPVICPELSYEDLGIQEGNSAQRLWMEVVLDGKRSDQKAQILDDLLKYCQLDTWAMVRIWQELQKSVTTE